MEAQPSSPACSQPGGQAGRRGYKAAVVCTHSGRHATKAHSLLNMSSLAIQAGGGGPLAAHTRSPPLPSTAPVHPPLDTNQQQPTWPSRKAVAGSWPMAKKRAETSEMNPLALLPRGAV